MGRIIRVSSNPGEVVLDPFAGSGTTLSVAKKLSRQWLGCELSSEYVRAATERLNSINEGDALDGPSNPVASAPATANGRKLLINQDECDGIPSSRSAIEHNHKVAATFVGLPTKRDLRGVIRDAIVDAFYATHEGFSIDWLLANPQIQKYFHESCHSAGLIGGPADWNRELLRLRKTGGFPKRAKTKRVTTTADEMDAYSFAAEIAWQIVSQQFGGASLDELFCDPTKAIVFDRTARGFGGDFAPERFRWAALHLRKSGKDLVEDATKYRESALKHRDFGKRLDWRRVDFDRYRNRAGIYLLRGKRDESLYVGYCLDLGDRLNRHAIRRHRPIEIESMSIVPADRLPADVYRAPLKVELARQYSTRFNVDLFAIHNSSA